jgi:hypothetical protein
MPKATATATANRSRRHLTLTAAQLAALEELAVLATFTDGFTYTPAMQRACKAIAAKATPASNSHFGILIGVRQIESAGISGVFESGRS